MKTNKISTLHKKVVRLLSKEHLTSFEILKKIKNTNLILNIYNVLDDLKAKGVLRTYIKNKMKVYYISKSKNIKTTDIKASI